MDLPIRAQAQGGETRIIRSGYGSSAVYARWARESLPEWLELERRTSEQLFVKTGALFVGRAGQWLDDTERTLHNQDIRCERLQPQDLGARFPQLTFPGASGIFEPDAGVLFARRAVQRLVAALVKEGVTLITGRITGVSDPLVAGSDAVIFACGPWLPTLFPELLAEMIVPTKQEVYFFGAPAADTSYAASKLPAWVAFDEGIYGLPDLEHRGVKIALDAHGTTADPESIDRAVSAEAIAAVREVLKRRLPRLANGPLLESRVCQDENTPDGHFLLDRMPGHDRVWIAGGGSGHGFKHGPAVGRYVADLVEGATPEPAFQLAARPARRRAVY